MRFRVASLFLATLALVGCQSSSAENAELRLRVERLEAEVERFTVVEYDGVLVGCAALYPFIDERAAEMACVANATGFGVSERGMEGPECKRVEEAVGLFDAEKMYLDGTGIAVTHPDPSR